MGGSAKLNCAPVKHDYSKLQGAIKEHFGKQGAFAVAMGLSERSVSLKLNNLRCWTQDEMRAFCNLIGVEYTEIPKYFFTLVVQK